jgi:hypothetical protein
VAAGVTDLQHGRLMAVVDEIGTAIDEYMGHVADRRTREPSMGQVRRSVSEP